MTNEPSATSAPQPAAHPASVEPTQPAAAPAEVQAHAVHAPQPVLAQPVTRPLLGWGIAGFSITGIALLLVLLYFVAFLGPGLVVIASVIAIIPLAIVLAGVLWIDRWEPEPRGLLVFGFLWGATVSIVISLIVDLGVQIVIGEQPVFQTVVQAPLVEESAKGLGVLLIFLVGRRYFDGPVDGIVYGAVVAAGFAFTENIQYFAIEVAETGAGVIALFVIRGLMSPFAHVMFTMMTGLGIGLGARKNVGLAIVGGLVGLLAAMALHALWNGAAVLSADLGAWVGFYVIVQVPLFIGAIVLVVLLRKQEAKLTAERLHEYAAAGWLSPEEVPTLATPAGRRVAMTWARSHGMGPHMKRYIRDTTKLALTRQRIIAGRDRIGAQADEAALLALVTASREALRVAPRPAVAS